MATQWSIDNNSDDNHHEKEEHILVTVFELKAKSTNGCFFSCACHVLKKPISFILFSSTKP